MLSRVTAIQTGLYPNPAFPSPPVDAASFTAAVAGYSAAIAAALDGGKTAIAERHKRREVLIAMLRLLGSYVESASNGDMTTFLSSGFVAATPPTPGPPQPLAQPNIVRIDNGTSGQLLVNLKAVAKARHYELRYASVAAGGIPGPWASILVATALLAPHALLWILGKKYEHLETELLWMIASACVGYLTGVMWTMHSARKWIFSWGVWSYMGGVILVQIAGLVFMDLSTTKQVILFSLYSSLATLAVQVAWAIYGFMQNLAACRA